MVVVRGGCEDPVEGRERGRQTGDVPEVLINTVPRTYNSPLPTQQSTAIHTKWYRVSKWNISVDCVQTTFKQRKRSYQIATQRFLIVLQFLGKL